MATVSEGIYLIQIREFITTNKNIYKIGRSHNIHNRMSQYPKESNIIIILECCDSIKCENALKKIFIKEFIQMKKYGSEYFEGDKEKMKSIIFHHIEEIYKNKIKEDKLKADKLKADKIKKNKIKEDKINKTKEDKPNDVNINIKATTCPKCNTKFEYTSYLKRHLLKSSRCKLNILEIENIIKKKDSDIICSHCNRKFTKQSSLVFHNKNSQCGKSQINIKSKIKDNIQINIIQNKDKNIINKTNIINPFTSEITSTLSFDEMVKLLDSTKPEINIIKLVYSLIQNKNFFKSNIGKQYISYLTLTNTIDMVKENVFKDLILKNSIELLKIMLIDCVKKLSNQEFIKNYIKINNIEKQIKDNTYEDKELKDYLFIHLTQNSKNIKKALKHFTNNINDDIKLKENSIKNIEEQSIIKSNKIIILTQKINELKL